MGTARIVLCSIDDRLAEDITIPHRGLLKPVSQFDTDLVVSFFECGAPEIIEKKILGCH